MPKECGFGRWNLIDRIHKGIDMKSSNLVWIKGKVRSLYEKTFSIEIEGERHFLPYSQLKSHTQEELEPGTEMELGIPRWLAEDRGLG